MCQASDVDEEHDNVGAADDVDYNPGDIEPHENTMIVEVIVVVEVVVQ